MSKQKLLIIAAGGTGGHMFPAQALAEQMLNRGWRVKLSTDRRGARFTGGFSHSVVIEVADSATFARGGLRAKVMTPFHLLRGTLATIWRMLRDRPDVVAGFGGYPAIPAMAAAWVLRCPRLLHEQNGVLGRVNRLFARRVDLVACGTWPTELPGGVSGVFIGNPVRRAVMERAGAQYIPPGAYPMSLLVIGGSQGARILSDVVPSAIALLPDSLLQYLRVSHQARAEDAERVRKIYAKSGVQATVEPFFKDVPARLAECQLVVSRAGASSIADISVIGRPSILIPLAAALRDEQTANARGLAESGGAVLIPEADLADEGLSHGIRAILSKPDLAGQMAHAALEQGKPDAAESLASLVEDIAAARGNPLEEPR